MSVLGLRRDKNGSAKKKEKKFTLNSSEKKENQNPIQ
jgi:hypothetical protein